MLDWQQLGVTVVVGGAVAFLLRRFVSVRRQRRAPAGSFVPLSSLKRKKSDGCH